MTTSETTMPPLDVKDDHVASNGSPASVLPKSIGNKLLKHSHNADAAMKAFEGMEGQVIELTEEKSKALLRKIDWHLMPVGLHFPPSSQPSSRHVTSIDHVPCLRAQLS